MIINKDDELVAVLNEFTKDAKTPNCSTAVSKTKFCSGKGIVFTFSEGIEKVSWKNESVDFSTNVEGSFFVTVLLSELKKKDKVEIKFENSKVVINGNYSFTAEGSGDTSFDCRPARNDITFTKEQFNNLNKDFVYTIGDYFLNPKTTDVVGIACHQGSVYKLLPSISAYKISKFDAVIDETSMAQNYGHTTRIWLLPKKVVDITRGETVNVELNDEYIFVSTEKMKIVYSSTNFGTNVFKKRLNSFGIEANSSFLPLSKLKEINFEDFVANSFWTEEDKNVAIDISGKKAKITIDNCEFVAPIDAKDFKLCTNMVVLDFLLHVASDGAMIGDINDGDSEEYKYVVKEENSITFIPKTNYLD